jgi:hypothetical protein
MNPINRAVAQLNQPSAAEDLDRWLRGCAIVAGEIDLWDNVSTKVLVAIVHDGSGFNPAAAVAVMDHGHQDEVLQLADELLEEWKLTQGEDVFTGADDGMVWELPIAEAARVLDSYERVLRYIDLGAEMAQQREWQERNTFPEDEVM